MQSTTATQATQAKNDSRSLCLVINRRAKKAALCDVKPKPGADGTAFTAHAVTATRAGWDVAKCKTDLVGGSIKENGKIGCNSGTIQGNMSVTMRKPAFVHQYLVEHAKARHVTGDDIRYFAGKEDDLCKALASNEAGAVALVNEALASVDIAEIEKLSIEEVDELLQAATVEDLKTKINICFNTDKEFLRHCMIHGRFLRLWILIPNTEFLKQVQNAVSEGFDSNAKSEENKSIILTPEEEQAVRFGVANLQPHHEFAVVDFFKADNLKFFAENFPS